MRMIKMHYAFSGSTYQHHKRATHYQNHIQISCSFEQTHFPFPCNKLLQCRYFMDECDQLETYKHNQDVNKFNIQPYSELWLQINVKYRKHSMTSVSNHEFKSQKTSLPASTHTTWCSYCSYDYSHIGMMHPYSEGTKAEPFPACFIPNIQLVSY